MSNLANALTNLGRHDEALPWWEKALRTRPVIMQRQHTVRTETCLSVNFFERPFYPPNPDELGASLKSPPERHTLAAYYINMLISTILMGAIHNLSRPKEPRNIKGLEQAKANVARKR